MEKGKTGLLVIILLITIQWAVPALAKKAYISGIVITNPEDHLMVYFSVNDCFTVEMNQAIESGLNTTFMFNIRLYEKRGLWWDRKIADLEISHSIKYDNLKKTYDVRLSEQENKIITVRDFDEAERLMSDVMALKVTPLSNLRKGGRYKLQMMAELDKIKLPFYLHYVFFFLSLWDFETDWHTVDFRY